MPFLPISVPVQEVPGRWYGPLEVRFPVDFSGNPYDPDQNDVKVRFIGPGGHVFERLAWYDGEGAWHAYLVTSTKGLYKAELWRNGKATDCEPEKEDPKASTELNADKPLAHGFLRAKGDRFVWDDGTSYFPVGFDLAWQNDAVPDLPEAIAKMGASGVDWTRIWANHWDGKNPWWSPDAAPRQLDQKPLQRWDKLVQACDANGVSFQMVLFHHGQFTTTVNPNWNDNPWNAANKGGFLRDPADFFTDPEAKKRTRIWLRTAVARYAHSPRLMGWELFNEVEWVDAYKNGRVADVAAWHKEMADYIRSIDPYHHLVTSSSSMQHPEVWAAMDYLQPHTYPVDVRGTISTMTYDGRPGFFGEFGPGGNVEPGGLPKVVRDGIWAGLLSGQAGAGQYWYWDLVWKDNLFPEYVHSRAVLDEAKLGDHPTAKPISVSAETPERGTATIQPGSDWAPQTTGEIDLLHPTPEALRGWSAYFQSSKSANAGMGKPLTIRFNAPKPGRLTVRIASVSKGGARLHLQIGGKEAVFDRPAAAGDQNGPFEFAIDYPAGPVEALLTNDGGDWARLASVSAEGLAPTRRAMGLGESRWALIRVDGGDATKTTLSGLGLVDSDYELAIFDFLTGERTDRRVTVKNGVIELAGLSNDSMLVFRG
ncbi:hypothetical protein BH11ARM2_BH11ARM2_33020 [soil metagenome]